MPQHNMTEISILKVRSGRLRSSSSSCYVLVGVLLQCAFKFVMQSLLKRRNFVVNKPSDRPNDAGNRRWHLLALGGAKSSQGQIQSVCVVRQAPRSPLADANPRKGSLPQFFHLVCCCLICEQPRYCHNLCKRYLP